MPKQILVKMGRRREGSITQTREGSPGRHEPSLYRHEPPRFARQTEPQLCRYEHAQNIKMCLCNKDVNDSVT